MDITGFLLGVAIGVIIAFGTGFLKKAGEDFYLWLKGKVNPKSVANQAPQVVVHLRDEREIDQAVAVQSGLAPASIERLNLVSFDDIERAIDSAPPMHRDHVASRFGGLRVEWDTYLRAARAQKDGNVFLRLSVDKDYRGRSITCEVPGDEYRELGILPEGSHIRVLGEISKAESFEVRLSNVRLQILPKSTAA